METKSLIVEFAARVAVCFPELKGRSIAVSEVEPFSNKTNRPTLPIAFTALLSSTGTQAAGAQRVNLTESFTLNFMFEPVKYKMLDGNESPFFAFYDYEPIRDRLLSMLVEWETPRKSRVVYRSMDVASDEFAVYINFKLETAEKWDAVCHAVEFDNTHVPARHTIAVTTCAPKVLYCKEEEVTAVDPCPKSAT